MMRWLLLVAAGTGLALERGLRFGRPGPASALVRAGMWLRLTMLLRMVVSAADGGGALRARLTGPQGSGILTSMAHANGVMIVPEDRAAVAPGETLQALLLDDPHHVAEAPF